MIGSVVDSMIIAILASTTICLIVFQHMLGVGVSEAVAALAVAVAGLYRCNQ